jgi:hypothetical protein
VLLYAKNHAPDAIRSVVAQLQKTDGVDLIFTTAASPANGVFACRPGKELGWIPGTFSLELIHECNPARGADIIVTFQWGAAKNAFGYPGTQKIATNDTHRNVPGRSGHGGLNPYMVHTPLLFYGPDFRKHAVARAPSANYDIAPTLLKLYGIAAPASMRGRAITEAFAKGGGSDPKTRTRTVTARSGSYCATIQLSLTGKSVYLDQGQRCP